MYDLITRLKARKFGVSAGIDYRQERDLVDNLHRIAPAIQEAVKNALIIDCYSVHNKATQNVTVNLTINVKL